MRVGHFQELLYAFFGAGIDELELWAAVISLHHRFAGAAVIQHIYLRPVQDCARQYAWACGEVVKELSLADLLKLA